MDGGGGSFQGSQHSNSGFIMPIGGRYPPSQNIATDVSNNNPATIVHEKDNFRRINGITSNMRRVLPSYAKISNESKVTVQECVTKFVNFITKEANDHCQQEHRKIITPGDVLYAMGKLGFDDYVNPLSHFLSRYREEKGKSYEDVHSESFMVKNVSPPPIEQNARFFEGTTSLSLQTPMQPQSFHMRLGGSPHGIDGEGMGEFLSRRLSQGVDSISDNDRDGDGSGGNPTYYDFFK